MSLMPGEGLPQDQSPFPSPELDVGNIVRLKREFARPGAARGAPWRVITARWGIIVGHLERSFFGTPLVWLVLYDDEHRLLADENHIPIFFDIGASMLLLWQPFCGTGEGPVVPGGLDLYPTCPTCNGSGNNSDGSDSWCPACGGSGNEREMRRLPPVAPAPRAGDQTDCSSQ